MIIGAHAVITSARPQADVAFFRDVLIPPDLAAALRKVRRAARFFALLDRVTGTRSCIAS